MSSVTAAQPSPAAPLYVTQAAIDALCKESQFWVLASEFMLGHGLWKKIDT